MYSEIHGGFSMSSCQYACQPGVARDALVQPVMPCEAAACDFGSLTDLAAFEDSIREVFSVGTQSTKHPLMVQGPVASCWSMLYTYGSDPEDA